MVLQGTTRYYKVLQRYYKVLQVLQVPQISPVHPLKQVFSEFQLSPIEILTEMRDRSLYPTQL